MGSSLLCNRSQVCITQHNVKLKKLWAELRPPLLPLFPPAFSPAAWRESRTPTYSPFLAFQSLHCYTRQRVCKGGYTLKHMLLEIGQSAEVANLLPVFSSLQWGSFVCILDMEPVYDIVKKSYQHSWRQHTQVASLLYYTKCIHLSVPLWCRWNGIPYFQQWLLNVTKADHPAFLLMKLLPLTSCRPYYDYLLCIHVQQLPSTLPCSLIHRLLLLSLLGFSQLPSRIES